MHGLDDDWPYESNLETLSSERELRTYRYGVA